MQFHDRPDKGRASVYGFCATFLFRVVTGDKGWVYGYDPETQITILLPIEKSTLTGTKKGERGEEQSQEHALCS
jgi:hypothetical protein